MGAKIWLITGCSSGLGRALGGYLLERGDRVALTARDPTSIADLVAAHGDNAIALGLDVIRQAEANAAVVATVARFGGIDVLVNNAGVAIVSAVEDASDADIRAAFDTNFFGLMNVTRAVLPIMRAQGRGHVINVSSGAGRTSAPMIGLYSATKHAVEGMTQALALELAPHGVKVTAVEPGAYATRLTENSITGRTSAAYAGAADAMKAYLAGGRFAPPIVGARVIAAVADLDEPPVRVPAGTDALDMMRAAIEGQRAELERWAELATCGEE